MWIEWMALPVVLSYLGLLFLIAWYGDHHQKWLMNWRAWIYSLSISVYCTYWIFFGTIEQVSSQPWSFLPIYFVPILVFLFCWRFLAHLIVIAKREHISSIADFIAARYDKSQGLAMMVTVITLIGVLPFIALQLRAITLIFDVVAPNLTQHIWLGEAGIAGLVCLVLALFTLIFGTRHIDTSEHHHGVMLTIAFQSVVKLLALICAVFFALILMFDISVLLPRFEHVQWLKTPVIALPLLAGNEGIALIAFIAGISVASGMVVVSIIALAIMVSNDLVLPQLLRRMRISKQDFLQFSGLLINLRRGLICLLLFGAWGFYLLTLNVSSLVAIGFLSFAAIVQFAPPLVAGIYWRRANKKGVYAALSAGFTVWLMTLIMQTEMLGSGVNSNLFVWLLTPPNIPILNTLNPVNWGMALSLMINIGMLISVSLLTHTSLSERLQSASFVGMLPDGNESRLYQSRVTVAELEMLGGRFVGYARMRQTFQAFADRNGETLLAQDQASEALVQHTERVLSGVFGASSAKLVLSSALQGRKMRLEDIATIVDEASELFDFSRGLLQGAIEHISQGISVVDKQLRLVAWNQRYIELFNFPPSLIQMGRPIADVVRYNADRGLCGPGDVDELIRKRVAYLHLRSPHVSSRAYPDGRVIEVQGNPMPGGGFVMSFSDITAFRNVEKALKQANETLEARVDERTHALGSLNRRLSAATVNAEQASQSKSRLLAAVSHDLMQPLNAARLFASSLSAMAHDSEVKNISAHIESALGAAEDLIGDLLDISHLESGKMTAKIEDFDLDEVFSTLAAEFGMIASKQGVQFRVHPTRLRIRSDKRLLRRVLQNFLTNAFRYNPTGRVLLGGRRKGDECQIEVWDNGPGIAQERQQDIFNEFTRIDVKGTELGLGLGLSIARGISRILDQPLSLRSWPQKGSVFAITAHCVAAASPVDISCELEILPCHSDPLMGVRVLCIDNEPDILLGMESLLSRWGCDVKLTKDLDGVVKLIEEGFVPDVIVSDYHLAHSFSGLEVLLRCRELLGEDSFVGIVITADRTQETRFKIRIQGFAYLAKPIKPLKLRALLHV